MATPLTSTAPPLEPSAWKALCFIRLWGLAMVAHVVGNWSQPDLPRVLGWINLAVGLIGVVLIARPKRSLLLLGSGFVVVSVILEMPFTGNHWIVAGLVSFVILGSGGHEERFFPGARWVLLVFYSFAALAKLNSGFLDPSVSCAAFYTDQALAGLGLRGLDPASSWKSAVIWVTVATELSVPPLLMIRRTRYWGVLLASAFHIIISYDLLQHFYDFTSVLLPLFLLFLPDQSITIIAERTRHWFSPRQGSLLTAFWLIMGSTLVIMAAAPLLQITLALLRILPFGLWVPLSLLWLSNLVGARAPGQRLGFRLHLATGLVVLLTLANGLTPYFELKTAYGFNMYANLVTAEGRTNHLLIDRTFPLRDGYEQPIEIIASSDPGLELYRDLGYLVAYPQLRRYLAEHPDVSLKFRRGGELVDLKKVSDIPELVDPGPWWWRFLALRSLDTQSRPRCQEVFLPAL